MAKKQTKAKKKPTTTRKRGRPKRAEPVWTPEMLERCAEMWLQRYLLREIAEVLGVSESSVRYHLDKEVRPAWKERLGDRFDEQMAEIEALKTVAWSCFRESKQPRTKEDLEYELNAAGKSSGSALSPKLVRKIVSQQKTVGDTCWLDIIKWCHEFEAKVLGHFAPTKIDARVSDERFKTREQLMQELRTGLAEAAARQSTHPN